MAPSRGQVRLHVQSKDLQELFVQLKAMEGNLQVELRRGVREAAGPMVAAVRANYGWSPRIAGAVRAKPSFRARGASVSIEVDAKRAPHARPIEHGGEGGTFRHPVYGNRNNWVDQQARPSFYPAVGRSVATEAAMRLVMERVALKAGFR